MSDSEVLAACGVLLAQRQQNEVERGHKRSYDSVAASGEGEGDENYDEEDYCIWELLMRRATLSDRDLNASMLFEACVPFSLGLGPTRRQTAVFNRTE